MPPTPVRASSDDRCPGALRLHQADDGHVARIRVPGGRLTPAQLVALADLADALGDGVLHLTSRANVQVRGLYADAGEAVATALQDAGLLPSLAHDRVRNVVASPHGGPLVDDALAAFDRALVADPRLASLSGRFLFGIDDGSGDVLALSPDLAVSPVPAPLPTSPSASLPTSPSAEVAPFVRRSGTDRPPRWQLVVDGRPTGEHGEAAALLVAAAHRFLDARDAHAPLAWRVSDLGGYADLVGAPASDDLCHLEGRSSPPRRTKGATSAEGWVPLGAATSAQWRAVAELAVAELATGEPDPALPAQAAKVVLTPWRSVVIPSVRDAEKARIALQDTGFAIDPTALEARTTACIGAPGCGKALADVRRDAAGLAAEHLAAGRPTQLLHVSGCERRCGRPTTPHLDAVATATGYQIQEH